MALGTYAALSTAVFRRLNRAADTSVFDDCIALAEAEMNRRLAIRPVKPQHNTSTSILSTERLAVPADYLDADSFYIDALDWEILPTSPQNLQAMKEREEVYRTDLQNLLGVDAAPPRYYAVIDNEFRFYPVPDTSYTVTLTYWAKVPNLNGTATSNWMLTTHPDVYFHGVLAHAYQEYFDEEAADKQAGLFDIAIDKVLSAHPSRPDRRGLRSELSMRELRF